MQKRYTHNNEIWENKKLVKREGIKRVIKEEEMKNNGRILCLIGGGGLIIGSLLPWVTMSATLIGSKSFIGIEGDGIFTAAAGALIIIFALLTKETPGKYSNLVAVILSVLALIMLIYKLIGFGSILRDLQTGIDANIGSGLYISIISTFFPIIGGLIKAPEVNANQIK